MCRVLLLLIGCAGLFSCFTQKKKLTAESVIITPSDSLAGQYLLKNENCITCHNFKSAFIGPSFQKIANRYESNRYTVQKLADKIINGGYGNWGEVPMVSHLNLTDSDAQTIIKYILSLKSK